MNVKWDPNQYDRFRTQRMEPFWDVLRLLQWAPGMRLLDLGCGTGELSMILSERLDADVDAMDSSPDMLEKARSRARSRVRFRQGDIADEKDFGAYDVIFANASLQWVPDHETLFPRILAGMKRGAQIAVQMPKNQLHPSHTIARDLAGTPPFRDALANVRSSGHGLAMERYTELLDAQGFREQVAYEKVYGHRLDHSSEVFEWVRGTLLNGYVSALPEGQRARFLEEYKKRLADALGDRAPYFYPFRRMILWGKKGTGAG